MRAKSTKIQKLSLYFKIAHIYAIFYYRGKFYQYVGLNFDANFHRKVVDPLKKLLETKTDTSIREWYSYLKLWKQVHLESSLALYFCLPAL